MTRPVQPAGVQAVVVNIDGFLRDLGRMNSGMIQLGNVTLNVTNRLNASGQAFGGVSARMTTITKVLESTRGGFNLLGSVIGTVSRGGLSFFSRLASVAGGFLGANAILGIVRRFDELTRSITDAASQLRILELRLENLIGLQLRNADATLTYEDSIRKVQGAAQETIGWITRLAQTTPVSAKNISDMFTLQLAMGFTVQETKNLTQAIVDFTAGAGLGSEVAERIIFNLAQMKTQAKVTSTELRDLARGAFVPVDTILRIAAKNMGVAAGEFESFRKAASEGRISVDEFFKAFVQFANESFPNAAQKLNNTMQAFRDNIRDFFTIQIGWGVFADTVSRAAEVLNKALAALNTEFVTREFQLMGKAVLDAFNTIISVSGKVFDAINRVLNALGIKIPSLESFLLSIIRAIATFSVVIESLGNALVGFVDRHIIPFINGLTQQLGGGLDQVASDAFSWGANIVISLAEGMMRAAAAAITAAVKFIARILTSWLSASSPPKFLPDIGKWGAATFAEFLRGFSMADFDVLDSVQDALRGSLDALVSLGSLGEEAAGKLFKNLSKDLIRAIDEFNRTGQVGTEIFDKLRRVGGGFGKELATLLERQLAYAAAVDKAAAAEKAWKDAQEATKRASETTNKLIRDYNAALRGGAGRAALRERLKIVNASEIELDAARKREIAAEKANEEAQKQLDPLEEAVKLQEKLIQQLIELARMEKEAAEAAAGGGAGGGIGGEDPSIEIPPIDTEALGNIGDLLTETFRRIKEDVKKELGAIWDELIGEIDSRLFQPVRDKFNEIKPALDTFVKWWEDVKTDLETIWTNLGIFWDEHGPAITETLGEIVGILAGFAVGSAMTMFASLVDALARLSQLLVDKGPTIVHNLGLVRDVLKDLAVTEPQDLFSRLGASIEQSYQESVAGRIATIRTSIITEIGNVFASIPTTVGNAVSEFFTTMGTQLETSWNNSVVPVIEDIKSSIGQAFEDVKLSVTRALDALKWEILISWELIKLDAKQAWEALVQAVKDVLGIKSPSGVFNQIGMDVVQGAIDGIQSLWEDLAETIRETAQKLIDEAMEVLGIDKLKAGASAFFDIGISIVQGIIDGVTSMIQSALTTVRNFALRLVGAGEEGVGAESPSKKFKHLGEMMMKGMVVGILGKQQAVVDTIKKAMGKAITAANIQLEIASPSAAFENIGRMIMEGVSVGMQAAQAPAGQVAAPQVIRQTSISFGDVIIQNGMDQQLFEARIRQIVREEL